MYYDKNQLYDIRYTEITICESFWQFDIQKDTQYMCMADEYFRFLKVYLLNLHVHLELLILHLVI